MAFQQTTATNVDDICAQIATFAVANAGFTNAGTTTVSSKVVQRLSKGGIHFHFGANPTGNNLKFQMGYALVAGAWPTTANGSQYFGLMSCQAFAGPYTNLFMFTDGNVVHVVVELTNGIYNHFAFGSITKTETFVGGEFMTAGFYSYISSGTYNAYVNMTSGNEPPFVGYNNSGLYSQSTSYMRNIEGTQYNDQRDFAPIGRTTTYTGGTTQRCSMSGPSNNNIQSGMGAADGTSSMNDPFIANEPNTATMRAIMHPNYVFTYNAANGLWRLSGHIPSMRVLNMNSIDEKELIYTDWQVFPLAQRNGSAVNTVNTGQAALAYKRA